MTDTISPTELRDMIAIVERYPGNSAEAWRERARAQHVLADWRVWLPALLDLVEGNGRRPVFGASDPGTRFIRPVAGAEAGLSQAEAEARGLV